MLSEGDRVKLTLPDGTVILENGRSVKPNAVSVAQPAVQIGREIQSGRQAARTLERMHRKLVDLPETSDKMNAIAAVLMYTNIGISDDDIAVALRTSTENIARLKALDSYTQLAEMLDNTVFEDARTNAKHIIARASDAAAQRFAHEVHNDDPNIALVASRDVMRIAGVDAGRESSGLTGLKIVIESSDGKGDRDVTVTINGE